MKVFSTCIIVLATLFLVSSNLSAHCEIPCGIYDDALRIKLLREDIATIEKSMSKISELEAEKQHNSNQLIRWVMNKEEHANKLQEIVTQYFMTQRIKVDTKDYQDKISLLHRMLVSAMKAKQTVDFTHTEELKTLVDQFEKLYFAPHE